MDKDEEKLLLELVRETIYATLDGEAPNIEQYQQFSEKRGCFVTLYRNKRLRGCIGFTEPLYPLYKLLSEAAKEAAFNDPRFFPIRKEEVPHLAIEISLLTKPKLLMVKSWQEYLTIIVLGRDGLIIRAQHGSGLLLPQVPVEHHMDVQQFLHALCQKAGLGFDDWKNLDNKIYAFQAEIIKE